MHKLRFTIVCGVALLEILVLGVGRVRAESAVQAPSATPVIARVTTWKGASDANVEPERPDQTIESMGFVIEASGLLVTTYRAVHDPIADQLLHAIEVELLTRGAGTRKSYPASIVAVEPTLNLALLKIDSAVDLEASAISPRERIESGQPIHAPVAFDADRLRFTRGVLTATNTMECYQESMTEAMYLAKIEVPDSMFGAPLFANNGEVVAMHTGYTPRPTAVSEEHDANELHILPIHLVSNIYESLKHRKSLKSPWTGFSIRPLDAKEASLFPTEQRFLGGVAVEHVWANSPAERLGIRANDILVRFSYYPITSAADFQKWLYQHGVGHAVKLHFLRGGVEHKVVDYVIEERPSWARPR